MSLKSGFLANVENVIIFVKLKKISKSWDKKISCILELKNLEDNLSGKHMCVSLSRIFIHECGNFSLNR